MAANKTKVWIEDEDICVQYANGEILRTEKNNSWLWLLGAIHDETPLIIKDERNNLQDHQHRLDCERWVRNAN